MKMTSVLQDEIKNGIYDEILKNIYVDINQLETQKTRYAKAIAKYETLFEPDQVAIFSAPGRSEIGGNHTDHQHGMVLAASVNQDAIAVVGRSEDGWIEVVSEGYSSIRVSVDELDKREEEEGTTIALVRGVTQRLRALSYQVGGFRAYITSDVLGAAGLSSSACFETIIGTIISGLFNEGKIPMTQIAQVGQYAENVYFGKPCGLMDQMACAVGGLIHIDFKDPKDPLVNKVDVDFDTYQYNLCIVDTKGSHADLTMDYALVPAEMKSVAIYFDKTCLRDVSEKQFYQNIATLRGQLSDRPVLRAMHFFEEEKRVVRQVTALKENRFDDFLKAIMESGNSSFKYLQNVYTNQDVKQQGVSVALGISEVVLQEHGVSRVHGGGFAGTIQAFVQHSFVDTYKLEMEKIYGAGTCHVLNIRKYGGIQVI